MLEFPEMASIIDVRIVSSDILLTSSSSGFLKEVGGVWKALDSLSSSSSARRASGQGIDWSWERKSARKSLGANKEMAGLCAVWEGEDVGRAFLIVSKE